MSLHVFDRDSGQAPYAQIAHQLEQEVVSQHTPVDYLSTEDLWPRVSE